MGFVIRVLVRSAVAGGLAYGFRKQLVHLLTKTTGTWVGSPDA